MKSNRFLLAGSALGMLILILDARTAISGGREAIALCLQSVIPSLFPFLMLSGLLTSGIAKGTAGVFIAGLLGGYPTGARLVTDAWKMGFLSRDTALRMMAYCSNAGPAFIFGIIGGQFSDLRLVWVLWGIQILSACLVAALIGGNGKSIHLHSEPAASSAPTALKHSVETMGYICGWVVLFRILLAFLERWVLWLLPAEVRVCIYGILELTNGCCSLQLITSEPARFVICSGMLAFGGLCVVMQTASITDKLGMGLYLPGKLLQTAFAVILSGVWVLLGIWGFLGSILLIFVISGLKYKIRGRNPVKLGI